MCPPGLRLSHPPAWLGPHWPQPLLLPVSLSLPHRCSLNLPAPSTPMVLSPSPSPILTCCGGDGLCQIIFGGPPNIYFHSVINMFLLFKFLIFFNVLFQDFCNGEYHFFLKRLKFFLIFSKYCHLVLWVFSPSKIQFFSECTIHWKQFVKLYSVSVCVLYLSVYQPLHFLSSL